MNLNKKIKGGALYIAIIISIVTGIILSVFILIASRNQRQVINGSAFSQLRCNLKSGINMAQSLYFDENFNNRWLKNEFNEDSIKIKKLQWGAYEMISVETKNRHQYMKEAAIYGVSTSMDTAILTADRGRAIGLGGKIKITGSCYFPVAGIKQALIEGENYNSTSSVAPFLRRAPNAVHEVKPDLVSNLKKCMEEIIPQNDSIVPELRSVMGNNFSNRTVVIQKGYIKLSNYQLAGNIKLVCKEISIEKDCVVDNILIVAQKAVIRKGFKGCVHVIATDSIIVEDECVLEYPSSLTVLNGESTIGYKVKGVFIGEKCVLHGSLMAINEEGVPDDSKVMVQLNKDVEVYGLIYSSNYTHVQGKIFGNVYCESLMLQTKSAVYENHILNCEVDPKKYGSSIVIPSIYKKGNYKCCKWI